MFHNLCVCSFMSYFVCQTYFLALDSGTARFVTKPQEHVGINKEAFLYSSVDAQWSVATDHSLDIQSDNNLKSSRVGSSLG